MTRFALIFMMTLLVGLPSTLISAPLNSSAKSNIRLTKTEFIVFDKKTSKPSPSNIIDYSKHNSYGWNIEFEAPKGKHQIKEVVKLPSPANWGVGVNTVISADQTTATTITSVESKTTKFSFQNLWGYAPGDPTGVYVFEIYVDNILVKTYVINVVN